VRNKEAIGERIVARGGRETSGHVAGERGVTTARWNHDGVSNAGSPVLG
jgi:hypothetical protein